MPHFFIKSEQVNNDKISISDKENYFHIARSLRARTGEKLLLIDENKIQYETIIEMITVHRMFFSTKCWFFFSRALTSERCVWLLGRRWWK